MIHCPCGCHRPVKPGRNTYAGPGCVRRKYPPRLCACGCGRLVKMRRPTSRWATPQCVPRAQRQASGRRSREVYSMARRRARFGALCDRVLAAGHGTITRGELYAAFQEVAKHEWENGYQACEWKWQRRAGKAV